MHLKTHEKPFFFALRAITSIKSVLFNAIYLSLYLKKISDMRASQRFKKPLRARSPGWYRPLPGPSLCLCPLAKKILGTPMHRDFFLKTHIL